MLGPEDVISEAVVGELRKLGNVKRISGPDPVTNAIAFARFTRRRLRLGRHRPGPRLRVRDAPAGRSTPPPARRCRRRARTARCCSSRRPRRSPRPLQDYLLDIQPGYDKDPVRGVYNHGWLMGDEAAISADVQSRIDTLLEIQPVDTGGD